MLKLILSISLAFFSINLLAQSEILLDSFFYFDNDNLIISDKYQYDEQGRLVKRLYNHRANTSENLYRYSLQYFEVENIKIETVEIWRDNKWNFSQKYFKEFDARENIIKEEIQVWNKETNVFEFASIIESTYNENDRIILKIRKADRNLSRTTWTYNENNQLLLETSSGWNEAENKWKTPNIVRENRYDEIGNLIYRRYSAINSFTYEDAYTYNVNNQVEEFIRFILMTNQDTLSGEKEKYYYTNDMLSKITHQTTDINTLSWNLPSHRSLIYYDNNGRIIEEIEQDSLTSNWRNLNKIVYAYDNGFMINSENIYWDSNNNDWSSEPFRIDNYEYDEFGEVKYHQNESYNNGYVYNHKWFYYRSEKTLQPLNAENTACLFPNPYVNYQTIYCETLVDNQEYDFMVSNLLGQKVYQSKIIGKNGFRVEQQLEKGWYLFTILENGKAIGTQKILIF